MRNETRAEKLARQRDEYLAWARTATSDEPPGDLGTPPPEKK